MVKFIWTALLILITGVVLYVLFIFVMWFSLTRRNDDLDRRPECDVHKQKRIYFSLKDKSLNIESMIDSFCVIHPEYLDSTVIRDNRGNINDSICCCIDYNKTIVFNKPPQEIYTLDFAEDERSGFIDIVSTNRNGIWYPVLTSKLDSAEKQRIIFRFNNEVLAKLSIVKDTSWRSRK